MEKDKLSLLADQLVQQKAAALEKEGQAKIKKAKTGILVFALLAIFFLTLGVFFFAFHYPITRGEETTDFHDLIGMTLFYIAIPLAAFCLFCVYAYSSLYKEGQKALKESAKIKR